MKIDKIRIITHKIYFNNLNRDKYFLFQNFLYFGKIEDFGQNSSYHLISFQNFIYIKVNLYLRNLL